MHVAFPMAVFDIVDDVDDVVVDDDIGDGGCDDDDDDDEDDAMLGLETIEAAEEEELEARGIG